MTKLPDKNSKELTPMMKQYFEIKDCHKDCILFFRMGDFYEMFYDDAVIVSSALGIFLTKKTTLAEEIPMCGIPFHSYETYLNRLIKLGYKVAICEQTETPQSAKQRGYKAIVNREVVRIVTQGTLIEESLLESNNYNYLVAIYYINNVFYVSWLDVSTNDFYIQNVEMIDLNNVLYTISPKEIIVLQDFNINLLSTEFHNIVTFIDKIYKNSNLNFSLSLYEDFFYTHYKETYHLFSDFDLYEKYSLYILLSYLLFVYKKLDFPSIPKKEFDNKYLKMDIFTRKSLEIVKNYSGEEDGSLKKTIDFTLTKFGSRMLNFWINHPLLDYKEIEQRLSVVDFFYKDSMFLDKIRGVLKNIPDIERSLGRILVNKSTPKDLLSLRDSLREIFKIKLLLVDYKIPHLLEEILNKTTKFSQLSHLLEKALSDVLVPTFKESGFLKDDYKAVLKAFKIQRDGFSDDIKKLQQFYIVKYEVGNLKISNNNLSGYYIEISGKQSSALLENKIFKHKQTLSNSVRYTTDELLDLEKNIVNLELKIKSVELDLLDEIIKEIIGYKDLLLDCIGSLGCLDILTSFAYLSLKNNFVFPVLTTNTELEIIDGRHLVVENRLKKSKSGSINYFMPNSCVMNEEKNIFLITGPNMSGKSTFLRQNALIIILAQMGCFVPAKSARIGLVDAIYSRVGASDDLFKGQSTFMVEMLELSAILHKSTYKSFLILDEIGRGTSTYDGLSIAWSTLEYLHNVIKAKVLFATHYHELTQLENKLKKLECYCIKVDECNDNIVFLYEIIKGYVKKSYGIEVAKLAGIPSNLINRAYEILSQLEQSNNNLESSKILELDFKEDTDYINNKKYKDYYNKISKNLELNLDDITPKQALEILYNLKKIQ